MFLTRAISIIVWLLVVGISSQASAEQGDLTQALARLQEQWTLHQQSQGLLLDNILPVVVVALRPYHAKDANWYPNAALAALSDLFGAEQLRLCEACTAAQVTVGEGRLVQAHVGEDVDAIRQFDYRYRQTAEPAKSALWLNATATGVSVRLVSLHDGRLLWAANIDRYLQDLQRSSELSTYSQEQQRRLRGESLTHTFVDATLFPSTHLALEWSEQWGATNSNLAGFTISVLEPLLGVGAAYHRIVPALWQASVGGKLLVSIPAVLATSLAEASEEPGLRLGKDPILTGLLVIRIPVPNTNYGVCLTASSNFQFGIGISLMNITLLPFLP